MRLNVRLRRFYNVILQHYIELNTQYLLVKDSSNEGYLRMQGPPEVADGYLPMVPESEPAAPHSGSDRYNVAEEDDVIYLTDLQCVDYDNISQRIRLSSSGSQRSRLPSGGSSGYRARVSSTGFHRVFLGRVPAPAADRC